LTGLQDACPIEIAAVSLEGLEFCERIRDLNSCQHEKEVLINFLKFLNGPATLIAHNAEFHQIVLENALRRHNLSFSEGTNWECTLLISKKKFLNLEHSLKNCCETMNIAYEDARSALLDAKMCLAVYKSFFNVEETEEDRILKAINEQELEQFGLPKDFH
jgi:DNA polymerase III epsilon subunit-like protein